MFLLCVESNLEYITYIIRLFLVVLIKSNQYIPFCLIIQNWQKMIQLKIKSFYNYFKRLTNVLIFRKKMQIYSGLNIHDFKGFLVFLLFWEYLFTFGDKPGLFLFLQFFWVFIQSCLRLKKLQSHFFSLIDGATYLQT